MARKQKTKSIRDIQTQLGRIVSASINGDSRARELVRTATRIARTYIGNIENTKTYQAEREKYVANKMDSARNDPNRMQDPNFYRTNFAYDNSASSKASNRQYSQNTYMGFSVS